MLSCSCVCFALIHTDSDLWSPGPGIVDYVYRERMSDYLNRGYHYIMMRGGAYRDALLIDFQIPRTLPLSISSMRN